jgi:ABC-2 type transport system permease protein
MTRAMHAEWTKLRTVAAPSWLLASAIVATVGLSALTTSAMNCRVVDCGVDTTKVSLTGVQLGQAIVAVLAVLVVGGEYGTGLIRSTLAATPRRITVLSAKATVVTTTVLVAGAIGALGSVLAGRLILPGHGFTVAHGYQPLSLADGPTLRAVAGSVLYLALIALLSIGVAALVRDSAVAIGVVLGLLYLFPILTSIVTDDAWRRHLNQISPSAAGLAIQDTIGLHDLPLRPWAGLGVLAAWAAGALLVGGIALRVRDA